MLWPGVCCAVAFLSSFLGCNMSQCYGHTLRICQDLTEQLKKKEEDCLFATQFVLINHEHVLSPKSLFLLVAAAFICWLVQSFTNWISRSLLFCIHFFKQSFHQFRQKWAKVKCMRQWFHSLNMLSVVSNSAFSCWLSTVFNVRLGFAALAFPTRTAIVTVQFLTLCILR